ncbi:MAG: zinc ribbon domain-containing protein [Desulfobaccales bacterium]
MPLFLLAILLGLIPAAIAQSKGRSFVAWWLYGALLFIVALPHSLLIKKDQAALERQSLSEGMKKCPFCGEFIKADAQVCRFCTRDLGGTPVTLPTGEISLDQETKKCPACAEIIKLEALKCRHCGEVFDPQEVAQQVEERRAVLAAHLAKISAGKIQCPRCKQWDVHRAYIEDGGQGDWCPHCKISLQKMATQRGV